MLREGIRNNFDQLVLSLTAALGKEAVNPIPNSEH
jgi:hypothetical protein